MAFEVKKKDDTEAVIFDVVLKKGIDKSEKEWYNTYRGTPMTVASLLN